MENLRSWQKKVVELLNSYPDVPDLIYIYGRAPVGKSYLIDYLKQFPDYYCLHDGVYRDFKREYRSLRFSSTEHDFIIYPEWSKCDYHSLGIQGCKHEHECIRIPLSAKYLILHEEDPDTINDFLRIKKYKIVVLAYTRPSDKMIKCKRQLIWEVNSDYSIQEK